MPLRLLIAGCLAVLSTTTVAATGGVTEGPWWLGYVVTLTGFVIAAAMVVWQLGHQHKNEIDLQSANFKSELKLQVYQEFTACLATAANYIGPAELYGTTAVVHARIYMQQLAQGIQPSPVEDRALVLLDKHGKATNSAIEVVYLIEKYIIIHRDLEIFKLAIGAALHDMGKAFHALFNFMLSYLPTETGAPQELQVSNDRQFSSVELEQFDALAQAYFNTASTLDCYLSDMRIELQVLLLGGLFPGQPERRQPLDASCKVICLDAPAINSLRAHFLKDTEWGLSAAQIYQEVQDEFRSAFKAK